MYFTGGLATNLVNFVKIADASNTDIGWHDRISMAGNKGGLAP
jgi:hypothetical protein